MKKTVAIVGGGSAALMLAARLDENKYDVSLYERNAATGRKFLVAGDGGFNLTHSEAPEQFVKRYIPAVFFGTFFSRFTNADLVRWLSEIGIETIIGTSKRIFPARGIKPIDVLNVFLEVLKKKNVTLHTSHLWTSWDDGELIFDFKNKNISVKADVIVFALGGSSWKVTGSDGSWTRLFEEKGIRIIPFQASNCAFKIKWQKEFIERSEGKSLKNILIGIAGRQVSGELVITKFGLEGGAIYALSEPIRKHLSASGQAEIFIDLKPTQSPENILLHLNNRGSKSVTKCLLDKIKLNETQIDLLRSILSKEEFTNMKILAVRIKKLPLILLGAAPIDEAISTVGGISLSEMDPDFQLKKFPHHYAIGEMLDWDAPTGGYLLQGCFSMAACLAEHLNRKDS